MLIVKYSPEGKAISDFKATEMAQKFIDVYNSGDVSRNIAHVSTQNFVLAMRVCIAQGLIDYKEVQFDMEGNVVNLDIMGQLHLLPLEYRGAWDKIVSGYMDACLKRAKQIHDNKQNFGEE